jgi:hypothetical protein
MLISVETSLRKKILMLILGILVGYVLILSPYKGIWITLLCDECLVMAALSTDPEEPREVYILPRALLRIIVNHKNINFSSGFDYDGGNSLELIMTQYLGMTDSHASAEDLNYALKLADRAIAGGAAIDGYRQGVGFTVLHDAIFRKNPVAVRFLVDHGSSCSMKIVRPTSRHLDNLNAHQLADFMNNKFPGSMKDIIPILKDCKDKNQQQETPAN